MLRDNVAQLVKHTSIYSLGWMASMAAGVFMLPIYTRYLSVADYGAVDLIQQTNNVFRILLASCFTYSVGRFFHDAKDDATRSRTISTCAMTLLLVSSAAACLCFAAREALATLLFGNSDNSDLVLVGALTMVCDQVYLGLTYQYLVEKRSKSFVYLNLLKLATGIIFNLFFVVFLQLGGLGMLLGILFSYIPSCLIAFVRCAKLHGLRIDSRLLKQLFAFGSPMIPAALLATVMHNGDRFLLRPYGSIEQLGIFMMALQFPSMLNSAVLSSFNSIWGGSMMFQVSKQKDGDRQIASIATYFMTAYVLLQTLLGIFAAIILMILVDPKFYPAIQIVPIACVGYSFHALYVFITSKAFTHGRPNRMIVAYAVPAIFKLAMTITLVPRYGYVASAWIMAATYLIFSLTCLVLFKNMSSVNLEFRRLSLLFLCCISALLISSMLRTDALLEEMVRQGAVGTGLLFLLWQAPFLRSEEKKQFLQEASSALSKLKRGAMA